MAPTADGSVLNELTRIFRHPALPTTLVPDISVQASYLLLTRAESCVFCLYLQLLCATFLFLAFSPSCLRFSLHTSYADVQTTRSFSRALEAPLTVIWTFCELHNLNCPHIHRPADGDLISIGPPRWPLKIHDLIQRASCRITSPTMPSSRNQI